MRSFGCGYTHLPDHRQTTRDAESSRCSLGRGGHKHPVLRATAKPAPQPSAEPRCAPKVARAECRQLRERRKRPAWPQGERGAQVPELAVGARPRVPHTGRETLTLNELPD